VDGQAKGGPGDRRRDLHVRRLADPAGGGKAGPSARGLDKPRPVGADLRVGPQVGHGDRGERDAGRAVPHLGDVDAATTALTGVHDASVLHLDPGLKAVGEPEAVGCFQLVQVPKHLGWWRIVVGDAEEPERQAVEALRGSLRDRRQ
jgi:hypothetical protein